MSKQTTSNPMWGGHYSSGPDALMERINASIDFDRALYRQDIAASIAHCRMLVQQHILSSEDGAAIEEGLEAIRRQIEAGDFPFSRELEDIHMNIESALKENIGEAAGRLHTARSRNDQVATDFRLWVRDAIDAADAALRDFQHALLSRAEEHTDTVMPGFTHLQCAQPVTLGHHLLAYIEMAGRDRGRLTDARARLNESPLGAAALAGTSFPIDREATAKALGFVRPMANSLDAVSDRDFALEYLSAAAITVAHLSRLAEELVLWASKQFNFITLSEAFTTGSSIMPQKRNPDAAELTRAKTGRIYGHLMGLLTVMKGLPLAYSKDMQEDKEPVFGAHDALMLCIEAMTGMVHDMKINEGPMRQAASAGFSTATDLADWLVRVLDVPFRNAHHITGRIVRRAEELGCELKDLPLTEMQAVEPAITGEVYDVLSVKNSVASRTSLGGTSPERVKEAIQVWRQRLN